MVVAWCSGARMYCTGGCVVSSMHVGDFRDAGYVHVGFDSHCVLGVAKTLDFLRLGQRKGFSADENYICS